MDRAKETSSANDCCVPFGFVAVAKNNTVEITMNFRHAVYLMRTQKLLEVIKDMESI